MKIGAQIGLWGYGVMTNLNGALRDISAAGLEGIETFADPWVDQYGNNPIEFSSLLSKFNVVLSGMYYASDFITPETQHQELEKATIVIQFLRAVNSDFLILHSGSARKKEGYPVSAYDHLADTMNKIGKIGHEHGIKVACHPHVDTMVETRRQLDLLMERLDPDFVGLCLHAYHFLAANTDPYEIYKTYADRVVYIHVSDTTSVDKIAEANRLIQRGKDRSEAYKKLNIESANFGHGEIDQRALMTPLLKAGFDGWIIIEGYDSRSTPLEGIQVAANYLRKEFRI
jgi:sugar phosphate isomerase/epimerase